MTVSSLSFRSYVANLSGHRLGAFKAAAAKLGITFDDYIGRIEQGQKNCIDCRQWKDRGEFGIDSTRWDGAASKCRECSSIRHTESYEPIPVEDFRQSGPPRELHDGDKIYARHLINLDVQKGRRPHPNDLFCVKCGHKGSDRRHEYHHHMGYAAEHVYDVVPLCTKCHAVEDKSSDRASAKDRSEDDTFTKGEVAHDEQ